MDEELIKWEKRNFKLRIVMIIILLLIGIAVLYNRYGAKSCLEDNKLLDKLNNPIIDCRGALIYYAQHKLGVINQTESDALYNSINYSVWGINTTSSGS